MATPRSLLTTRAYPDALSWHHGTLARGRGRAPPYRCQEGGPHQSPHVLRSVPAPPAPCHRPSRSSRPIYPRLGPPPVPPRKLAQLAPPGGLVPSRISDRG